MHILKRLAQVQMIRNLTGAFAGVMVALVLYSAYEMGSSIVAQILPTKTVASFSDPVNPVAAQEVGAKARTELAALAVR